MGNPALAPKERYTYGQYLTWPDSERWELIDGQAWDMSPAPLRGHQVLLGRLHLAIGNFLKGKPCQVFLAPFDVLLPEGSEPDNEVDTVVQPDIVVFCDPSKLTRRGARGGPDWVIEILSPRTAKKDFTVKSACYERAGVREYWIVDPASQSIHIWCLEAEGRFGEEILHEEGDAAQCRVLSGLTIDAREFFANLD